MVTKQGALLGGLGCLVGWGEGAGRAELGAQALVQARDEVAESLVDGEKEVCDWVVKGADVPPPSLFLPDHGGNMGL